MFEEKVEILAEIIISSFFVGLAFFMLVPSLGWKVTFGIFIMTIKFRRS